MFGTYPQANDVRADQDPDQSKSHRDQRFCSILSKFYLPDAGVREFPRDEFEQSSAAGAQNGQARAVSARDSQAQPALAPGCLPA